ncbi:MAG: single-stranded-DNA-specific exonuclease RecJ [Patescibacteria group bacterium]
MKWEILGKGDVLKTLLKNRGIKNSKEFFEPKFPESPKLNYKKAIDRLKLAKKNKEGVIVYGDYDADGICATAIIWEALHEYGLDVLPHIPDRFSEGYGLNPESVQNLKLKINNLKLIVTVDNGIVAYKGIKKAKELGIDVIVIDHHQPGNKPNSAFCILHSTLVSGSALAYFFAKELGFKSGLELAAIGTIADQMPLIGVNRSIVKYGLEDLNHTNRIGLQTLFKDSKVEKIGTYEVNYIIAPRINAMGRVANGLDSLRLLCTKKLDKAKELSSLVNKTNLDRQKIVDEVIIHARRNVGNQKIIVLSDASYHEGVIGLAAGKIVEEFYRPTIVISKGKEISKASARSISGFDIISSIRNVSDLIIEGGGHPMAAGFSIKTSKIEIFTKKINDISDKLLTNELLERKLKIDLELDFKQINQELHKIIESFSPTGLGNPTPTFVSHKIEIMNVRMVGVSNKHIKLKLKQGEQVFDAIYFGGGQFYPDLKTGTKMDVIYSIEENIWNNHKSLQLKIKDIKPLNHEHRR